MAQKLTINEYVEIIGQLATILNDVLQNGKSSAELPDPIADNPEFQDLVDQLDGMQQFVMALSRGDISLDLTIKGKIAGSLKSLQAQLRHLTWQVQRIADGDFSQRVAFMGDFATAFNAHGRAYQPIARCIGTTRR